MAGLVGLYWDWDSLPPLRHRGWGCPKITVCAHSPVCQSSPPPWALQCELWPPAAPSLLTELLTNVWCILALTELLLPHYYSADWAVLWNESCDKRGLHLGYASVRKQCIVHWAPHPSNSLKYHYQDSFPRQEYHLSSAILHHSAFLLSA